MLQHRTLFACQYIYNGSRAWPLAGNTSLAYTGDQRSHYYGECTRARTTQMACNNPDSAFHSDTHKMAPVKSEHVAHLRVYDTITARSGLRGSRLAGASVRCGLHETVRRTYHHQHLCFVWLPDALTVRSPADTGRRRTETLLQRASWSDGWRRFGADVQPSQLTPAPGSGGQSKHKLAHNVGQILSAMTGQTTVARSGRHV